MRAPSGASGKSLDSSITAPPSTTVQPDSEPTPQVPFPFYSSTARSAGSGSEADAGQTIECNFTPRTATSWQTADHCQTPSVAGEIEPPPSAVLCGANGS